MPRLVGRLAASGVAGLASLAIVVLTPPELSASPCQVLWQWNPATNECRPPAPPPPPTGGRILRLYTPPPSWAPPWAPASVSPPPPRPAWASPNVGPVWDPGHREWGIWVGAAWVPL